MNAGVKVNFTREDEHAYLELVPPNSMTSVYCIWWCHNTNDQRILTMKSSEKRITKNFNRRIERLMRHGWIVEGGGAGEDHTK